MARIRTIKPEFPQSESMGRVSRESRLCFLQLFTLADDHGKLRGNSRMLASLLYPYDDDAPKLIEKWLEQLRAEGCIIRYSIGDDHYIKIVNWESHQKVDRPTASKIPEPREGYEATREDSRGFAVGSEDQGRDHGVGAAAKGTRFTLADPPPDWIQFCQTQRPDLNPGLVFDGFRDYWAAKPGREGVKLDWFATWRNWVRNEKTRQGGHNGQSAKTKLEIAAEGIARAAAKREQREQGEAR